MNLSIIVPLYNESESILHFIDELSTLYSNSSDTEVIFVNDGSTDNTWNKIKEIKDTKDTSTEDTEEAKSN